MGEGDRQYLKHRGFMRLIGDASNPTFGISVDAASGALHLFDPPDWETDWNVTASSDPSLYIHTASTNAATDYLRLYHDDTSGIVDCDGTTMLSLTASTLAIANATTITTGGLTITAGGLTVNGGNTSLRGGNALINKHTTSNITTGGAGTYTAAQLLGGRITRDPSGGARTDTTQTAAQIVAAITGAAVGDTFTCIVENTADAAEAITLAGGTGVTLERLDGTGATVLQNGSAILTFVLTNVTADSEAVSCYVIAS